MNLGDLLRPQVHLRGVICSDPVLEALGWVRCFVGCGSRARPRKSTRAGTGHVHTLRMEVNGGLFTAQVV